MFSYICLCKVIQFKCNSLDPDLPQYEHPAACVIVQQYSSATIVSLHCHSRKEKLGVHFQIVTIPFLFFF